MITGIGHTAYRVKDIDASVKFYCDVLGFQEMFRMERDGELRLMYIRINDETFIELFPHGDENVEFTPKSNGYTHVCLTVDDMTATLEELAKKGLPITGEPKTGGDGNVQYWIADPDGNRIELMQMSPTSRQSESVKALKAAGKI